MEKRDLRDLPLSMDLNLFNEKLQWFIFQRNKERKKEKRENKNSIFNFLFAKTKQFIGNNFYSLIWK